MGLGVIPVGILALRVIVLVFLLGNLFAQPLSPFRQPDIFGTDKIDTGSFAFCQQDTLYLPDKHTWNLSELSS